MKIIIAFLSLIFCQCVSQVADIHSRNMANNRIMLVVEQPRSLGYYRLAFQTKNHPEMAVFLDRMGLPDCLAETDSSDKHYMILYYLDRHQAYSLRGDKSNRRLPLEMSGPYPITKNEYVKLTNFRKQALAEIH